MDAYTSFAQVYDLFMDNVPYDEWCAYICETLKKHGIADGPVLDLGCGTGSLTEILAREGYDMTGIDLSPGNSESHGKADRSADSLSAAGDADTRTGWMCAGSLLYL